MRPIRATLLLMAGFISGVTTVYYFLSKILLKFDPELKATKDLTVDILAGGFERLIYPDAPRRRGRPDYSRLSRPRPDQFTPGFGPETFGFICERCSHRVVNLVEDERNDKISRHLDNCAGPVRRLNERDDTIA